MEKFADQLDIASNIELENTAESIKKIQDKIPKPLAKLDVPIECNECGDDIEDKRALLGYKTCFTCASAAEVISKRTWSK